VRERERGRKAMRYETCERKREQQKKDRGNEA
jgi:hypothetical protein